MVRILTASGLTQNPLDFRDSVVTIFQDEYHPNDDLGRLDAIEALNWQVESDFQSIQDFFDSRVFETITAEVANEICQHMEKADRILIISYSAGSMIVETALSIIDQSLLNPSIMHVMLAPAINGASLAKIAPYAKAAIVAASAVGIGSGKLTTFWKVVLGGIGFVALKSLFSEQTVLDKLIDKIDEVPIDYAKIDRVILQGTKDNVVRPLPDDIPRATYYVGNYSHTEVGTLTDGAENQTYTTTHFGSPLQISKKKILSNLIEPPEIVHDHSKLLKDQ